MYNALEEPWADAGFFAGNSFLADTSTRAGASAGYAGARAGTCGASADAASSVACRFM